MLMEVKCSATNNLVPETPEKPSETDELAALLSRGLTLATPATASMSSRWEAVQEQQKQPPNYSVSQYYTHATALQAPSSQGPDLTELQLQREMELETEPILAVTHAREHAQRLIANNHSAAPSLNELERALVHGAISPEEYSSAVEAYAFRSETLAVHQHANDLMGMEEDISAHEMLRRAEEQREKERRSRERKDPVFKRDEWCNDYYGGLDSNASVYMEDMDDESPCTVYTGPAGQRLKPFDY